MVRGSGISAAETDRTFGRSRIEGKGEAPHMSGLQVSRILTLARIVVVYRQICTSGTGLS